MTGRNIARPDFRAIGPNAGPPLSPTKFFDRVFDNRWVKITAEWSGRRNLQFLRKKVSTRTISVKIWNAENLKKEMGRRRLRQERETEVESSK
jgi:hypothetical protein